MMMAMVTSMLLLLSDSAFVEIDESMMPMVAMMPMMPMVLTMPMMPTMSMMSMVLTMLMMPMMSIVPMMSMVMAIYKIWNIRRYSNWSRIRLV